MIHHHIKSLMFNTKIQLFANAGKLFAIMRAFPGRKMQIIMGRMFVDLKFRKILIIFGVYGNAQFRAKVENDIFESKCFKRQT